MSLPVRLITGAAIAAAGTATAGALIANEPAPTWKSDFQPKRLIAAGLGMGGVTAGIVIAGSLPKPGAPMLGAAAAGVGGLMLGMHVIGKLFPGAER